MKATIGKHQQPWEPKKRIEQDFKQALQQISKALSDLIDLLNEPGEIANKIESMYDNKSFIDFTQAASMKMVTMLYHGTAKSWRAAARLSSNGQDIYRYLKNELKGPLGGHVRHQIERNAEIIRTLPLDISKKVTKYISEETIKGKRASEIAKEIKQMFPEKSKASASLIARTEVSKTQTALTRARSENLNLEWYLWRTSEDARVRSSHRHMEGVLVRWTSPPSPELLNHEESAGYYHAGEIYNCRCYPQPLISLNDIKWPCKVYIDGKLKSMSKNEFEKIM